jgi:hypothetical protein
MTPTRHEKAMLAMQLGAPEGVLTMPGRPIAYFADTHGDVTTLYVHHWAPTGGFVCHTHKLTGKGTGGYSGAFRFGGLLLWYHFPTFSLLPFGETALFFTPEQISGRKVASRHFEAKHVTLPRQLHIADRSEILRRYYAREQANALLKHLPPGYILVPGAQRTAYRVLDWERIELVKPTTDARHLERGDGGALRFKTVKPSRRTGMLTIEKKQYRLDKAKKFLELVAQP